MKVAVTYENGEVFQHFGHSEAFKLYEVEGGEVKSSEVVPTNGSGHGALAGFLRERGVEVLICGGIGAGAQNALAEAGIKLYGGVSGSADSAVQALIEGNLSYNPDVMCDHHGEDHHGDHENCGGHGVQWNCFRQTDFIFHSAHALQYSPASFQCSRYRRCRKIFRKPRSGGSRLYDSANQCIYESFYRSFPRSERTGCPFLCDKTGKADV